MSQWYYNESGVQRGPVGSMEIRSLLESGRIGVETLVWAQGMADWMPLHSVPEFRSATLPPSPQFQPFQPEVSGNLSPYAPPASHSADDVDWSGYVPDGPQIRPWVRYWARTCDFLLFVVLFGGVATAFHPQLAEMNDTLLGAILLLIYNFVEPVMLATFGSTPFKALLRVRLRNQDGSKLGYMQGLARCFSVWIRGQGLGLGIIAIIANLMAHRSLTSDGITSWDSSGGYTVTHKKVGWRWIPVILFLLGFAALVVSGSEA